MSNDHTTIILIWTVCTIFKILDNIAERYVSTHDTSEKSKQEDENVFDKFPSKLAQVGPIRGLQIKKKLKIKSWMRRVKEIGKLNYYRINNGRCHKAQGRHFHLEIITFEKM